MPPVTRELWLYLLRKVNHKDNGKYKRGQGFFCFNEVQNDLCWYAGYRKIMYSKPQLTKSLRRLCEGNMIETTKATRGIVVTVCKYDYYQTPKNYEGNDEETTKESRKKSSGNTKNKNDKNEEQKNSSDISNRAKEFYKKVAEYKNDFNKEILRDFYEYWTEPFQENPNKMRFEDEKTWSTKRRLNTWLKNEKKFNGTPKQVMPAGSFENDFKL